MFHTGPRRWLLVGLLAIGVVAASAAIGMASHESEVSEIHLVLNDDFSGFQYGSHIQEFVIDKAECDVSLVGAPIMTISAETFGRSPKSTPGKVGLVEDGLGVNLRGNGNGQECGRTDYLETVDEGTEDELIRSEMLTLSLSDALDGRLMDGVTLDVEVKFDAVMMVEFLLSDVALETETVVWTEEVLFERGSDGGPDSGSNDKETIGKLTAGGELFNGIRISMISGAVSLEGGATWDDPDDAHHTIFHLASADASIELDTPPADGLVVAESEVEWTYTVTNTGGFPLSSVSIDVDSDHIGSGSCDINTDEPPILDVGASTECSVTFTSLESGSHTLTVTVSAYWEGGPDPLEVSATTSYFGALGCGEGEVNGHPGPLEKPYVGFVKGPDGPSPGDGCLAPISIESFNDGEEQIVIVGPVGDYPWAGTTGILTIEWDVENVDDPDIAGIARTQQRIGGVDGVDSPIPWCDKVVEVSLYDDPDLVIDWYYALDTPTALYPEATGGDEFGVGGGDTCLISQSNRTVSYGGSVHTQTLEIFYIWNDPIYAR